MIKNKTHVDGLYYAQGDIYDYEGGNFDAIIVFIEGGFSGINTEYREREEELKNCPVMVIPFNGSSPQRIRTTLNSIHELVFKTLNASMNHGCKNIGFHGIRVEDADDDTGAEYTIKAITEWLSLNGDRIDSITLVDMRDCYEKHFKNLTHMENNIYEYIANRVGDINGYEQQPMDWTKMKGGSAMKEIEDAKKKYTWFSEAIKDIKTNLSRQDVVDYYKEDLYKGFIATLLWGGAHTNHVNNFRRIVSTPADIVTNKLQNLIDILNQDVSNMDDWFGSMCRGGLNHIDGLGVSFFSKVFYFTTPIHELKRLLILDNKMWFVAQAFRKAHNLPIKNYPVHQCKYLDYAQYCVDMYAVPDIVNADQLEAYLFDHIDDIKKLL